MSEQTTQRQYFDQSTYQVRFEWGVDGLERLAPAEIVVVVDVLRFSTTVTEAVARGESVALATAHETSMNGARVAEAAAAGGAAVVLVGCLRNASAVARAVLAEQERRGARTSIAVIAAGELLSRDPGAPMRVAVEDQLGAGAIIAALGDLGIDHTAPDAAVAAESFRALRGAVRHLITASGSGQERLAISSRDEVLAAAAVDVSTAVPILRDGVFVAA